MDKQYRRAEPGARYVRADERDGRLVRLVANDDGVITLADETEQRMADVIGLPVTNLSKLGPKDVRQLQAKERD